MKRLSVVGKGYHFEEHPLGFYTTGDRIKGGGLGGALTGLGLAEKRNREADMSESNSIDRGVWALALATKDGLQRQAAREKLVALGREATPVLLRLLDDSEAKVRWEAALALKELADPASVEALVEALKDENGDVRWVAAEGLAAIGEVSMRPMLETLRQDADSFELRDSAHVAISLLEDRELRGLLAPVYSAMKDGRSPEVVMMAAAEALEALNGRAPPVA